MSVVNALPMALFPLMLVQAYGAEGAMDARDLFVFSKRKTVKETDAPAKAINFTYPYFALCLLSAGAASSKGPWFYPALSVILAWALWAHRPKAFSSLKWMALFVPVVLAGYAGHVWLHGLQAVVEDRYVGLFTQDEDAADPLRSSTAIGRIGALKLSGKIILRVDAPEGYKMPFLLHEANYNSYIAPTATWFAGAAPFKPVSPGPGGQVWQLAESPRSGANMRITTYFKRDTGVLPLPPDVSVIERLSVEGLEQNSLGTVVAHGLPGFTVYTARSGNITGYAPWSEADLKVPKEAAPMLSRISGGLGLSNKPPQEAVKTLADFFKENFRYSTYQANRAIGTDPLQDFLLKSRSGHCEYFATATVLLLRSTGIPARYATGYMVKEYSRLENAYVARARHAHAWTQVWLDDGWHDLDTTPPSWFELEEGQASRLGLLSDLWSWGWYKLSSLELGKMRSHIRHGVWLLIPLFVFFAWRLYTAKRVRHHAASRKDKGAEAGSSGHDSEFYQVEMKLDEIGLIRRPMEPLSTWIERVCVDPRVFCAQDEALELLRLHYRCRFDPAGISQTERARLGAGAEAWLKRISGKPVSNQGS